MPQIFEIHPSRNLAGLLAVLHALALFAWVANVESPWLNPCGAALIVLLGWIECSRMLEAAVFAIEVDPRAGGVTLIEDGQPYFFGKYKVYRCRWFAILKLIEQPKNRTLILTPDCFISGSEYQRLRFYLHALEARRAA